MTRIMGIDIEKTIHEIGHKIAGPLLEEIEAHLSRMERKLDKLIMVLSEVEDGED